MTAPAQNHPDLISEVYLSSGDILYHEGDPADCGFLIASGELRLYRTSEGDEIDVERRGPGSLLGELSILTDQPRTITAIADSETRLYKISAEHFLNRFKRIDPVVRAAIETSFDFVSRFNAASCEESGDVPLVAPTYRNPTKLIEQFQLECDILKGLGQKQFHLAYQPIVRLHDGGIVGFESLMRWEHPKLGNVPPAVFIDVAEAMGSINRLTDFALLESCAALKRLRQSCPDHPDLFASVNVSGEDIGRTDFVDFLAHALDLNDLEPKDLKLEVTETALVPNSKSAQATLKRLESFGCGISVDDFGVGYSNLAYLKELPLTALKIDRAFAGDAFQNSVSKSIVKMMIGLGRELGVDVVAEGLETQDDVDMLVKLGCDLAQGYHFSRPVSERELSELLDPTKLQERRIA